MKEIKCVIMDWAGTAVDYGCFAPLKAFLKVFKEEKGIEITLRQAPGTDGNAQNRPHTGYLIDGRRKKQILDTLQ